MLNAHDGAETAALTVFAASKPAEFEAVRAAEVAKKLADLDKPPPALPGVPAKVK